MLYIALSSALWMISMPGINGQACYNPNGYNLGVSDVDRCHTGSSNYMWCETQGECVTGTTCAECQDGTSWCASENQCCDSNYKCVEPIDGNNCTDVKYFNFGEEADKTSRCTLEELWCESLQACIPAMAMCPYCPPGFPQYCSRGTDFADFMNRGQCCSYDHDMTQCMDRPTLRVATEESGCKLLAYSTESCSCGPACISYSRQYFAECPGKCNDTSYISTGTFGKEKCDLNDYWPKNMKKEWTLLVLPCSMGEFAFLDAANSMSVTFVMMAIGTLYAFVY